MPVDVCEEAGRDSPSDVHEGPLRVEGSLPEELICGLRIVNLRTVACHDGRDDFSENEMLSFRDQDQIMQSEETLNSFEAATLY